MFTCPSLPCPALPYLSLTLPYPTLPLTCFLGSAGEQQAEWLRLRDKANSRENDVRHHHSSLFFISDFITIWLIVIATQLLYLIMAWLIMYALSLFHGRVHCFDFLRYLHIFLITLLSHYLQSLRLRLSAMVSCSIYPLLYATLLYSTLLYHFWHIVHGITIDSHNIGSISAKKHKGSPHTRSNKNKTCWANSCQRIQKWISAKQNSIKSHHINFVNCRLS